MLHDILVGKKRYVSTSSQPKRALNHRFTQGTFCSPRDWKHWFEGPLCKRHTLDIVYFSPQKLHIATIRQLQNQRKARRSILTCRSENRNDIQSSTNSCDYQHFCLFFLSTSLHDCSHLFVSLKERILKEFVYFK